MRVTILRYRIPGSDWGRVGSYREADIVNAVARILAEHPSAEFNYTSGSNFINI